MHRIRDYLSLYALHTGIEQAKGELIVIQGPDIEYNPHEFIDLLKPMLRGFSDIFYCSRFIGGNPYRALLFWHSIGN